MIIKARDWNVLSKSEKSLLVFGAFMNSLGNNIRRELKKASSAATE
ncbi:hypothetical protein KHA93_02840 [Bacillus sp. FJAT-49732]|uniref:Uncharacterized protein n=1 Tax=Lederbergia citrisecunda TaxID=2833583 RepID=A0A942TID1_9BACI|nr:hypothetical protein [Lederbergia citrisecunda]MBS4198585.1 hypothetical protein [Lederbergia citrisecunda]